MKLQQEQVQYLTQQQMQSVQLLQMSALELDHYLQKFAQENPVVELDEGAAPPEQGENSLICRLRWLRDNDRQNRYYQTDETEQVDRADRMAGADGLEETLPQFLARQLERMSLDRETVETVLYLATCLDEDGYLRVPLLELSRDSRIPLDRLERGAELLRSLEPAGVGAENLSQCLALQLRRVGVKGLPLEIVEHGLEDLAKCHWHSLAQKLSVTEAQVLQARNVIRELEPRPGAIFQRPSQTCYLQPDIIVERQERGFAIRTRNSDRPPFQINTYYQRMLEQTDQMEVRDYLSQKIRQAEQVLWAIEQRENTLLRCVQTIVSDQEKFFQSGPRFLKPMRMEDVARQLEVHPSTVSRAAREKYLQCRWGVYPLGYFFARNAVVGVPLSEQRDSGASARELLRQLIGAEDKRHPLSDQRLSEEMARTGCPISRRTVAKYREELHLPSAAGRRVLETRQ